MSLLLLYFIGGLFSVVADVKHDANPGPYTAWHFQSVAHPLLSLIINTAIFYP